VERRTTDTLLGLQRDSLQAILENVLAGNPCFLNSGSHFGQLPTAASAGAGIRVNKQIATSSLFNLFLPVSPIPNS
jgi:hypothetical protein